ncbi:hypothetical protein [uncultured Dokdonia sp.]|uniref:hypothetical protein n=1 Tax=uncultured Dokdonia sp. TaxID=575653 RepID=UPI00260BAAE3|nr:hypothetical protein [uncultured Dokdonia sp.]
MKKLLFTLSRKRIFTLLLLMMCIISCGEDDVLPPPESTDPETEDPITDPESDPVTITVDFTNVYGGSEDDTFHDVTATNDGGFIALGYSQSIDGDITDNTTQVNRYWLVKTDSEGIIQWSKTYGGTDDDRGEEVIQTSDGGYAMIGYSRSNDGDVSTNEGFQDHWIVKLDAQGEIEWQKSYGFAGSDQAFSIIQTSDGGYFTSGFLDVTASNGEGNDLLETEEEDSSRATLHGVGEFWGHKLDANGNKEWRRYFGGTNNDRAYATLQADDGGILMIGASESNDFDISNAKGSYDFWVVRIDASGNLLWERSYGGSEIDIAYAATKTPDGNYVIAGDTRSNDGDVTEFNGNADVWVIKINDQGTLLWEKTLGGTNFDTARAITATVDGLAITGSSRSNDIDVTANAGQNDIWIALLNTDGNLQDQRSIGGDGIDFGLGIASNDQGAIIVAGETQSNTGELTSSNGSLDAVLIKIN